MTADLSLVPDAAESDTLGISADCFGDRLGDRGLAYAGRSHKADNLSLLFIAELLYGKLFDNSGFYLFKAVVGPVKLFSQLGNDDLVLGGLVPRKVEHSVKISADNRGFLAAEGHFHQLAAFLEQNVGRFLVELEFLDAFSVFLSVLGRVVVLAEFFFNNALLFAQKEVTLTLVDAHASLAVDFVL